MGLLRPGFISIVGVLIWLIGSGPLYPYREAFFNKASPQIVLVLGGDIDREHVGIKTANDFNLPLIVSGGSNPEHANWLIQKAGVPINQVTLDYRAKDTLTNFTSLVDELSGQGIKHILLITSKDHLPRAIAVGNIIAGSRGIHLSSVSVSCSPYCQKESIYKQMVDICRAIAWVATGRDLKILSQQSFHESLIKGVKKIFRSN